MSVSLLEVTQKTLDSSSVVLFDALSEAEFIRDFKQSLELFSPYWKPDYEPDFSKFSEPDQARLYRFGGFFLIHYGKAKNHPTYQERGQEMLGRAERLFLEWNSEESAMECRMYIAIGFYNAGALDEFEVFLKTAEGFFKDKSNSIYLQIQINLAILELEENPVRAGEILSQIKDYLKKSRDLKIKTLYYTQAGLTHKNVGSYEVAIESFNTAYRTACVISNTHYQGLILNCLANTCRVKGDLKKALEYIHKALEIGESNQGWYAHFLDTLANIHNDDKEYEAADDVISQAIEIFRKGDDYKGLAEALWSQMEIFINFGLKEQAYELYLEALHIARTRINEKTTQRYKKLFVEKLQLPAGSTLKEKLNSVERSLIIEAMSENDGKRKKAAKDLGIDYRNLGYHLDVKHCDIGAEFDSHRQERSDKKTKLA